MYPLPCCCSLVGFVAVVPLVLVVVVVAANVWPAFSRLCMLLAVFRQENLCSARFTMRFSLPLHFCSLSKLMIAVGCILLFRNKAREANKATEASKANKPHRTKGDSNPTRKTKKKQLH